MRLLSTLRQRCSAVPGLAPVARARWGRLAPRVFTAGCAVVLMASAATFLPAPSARADDIVRRAQEELRKRNLYFGDIDGVPNRGTIGALRRYQERKRLNVTGEVDSETLRSLGIPSPQSDDASAPIEPDPWPDLPVLRSDQARRPPTPPPLAGEPVLAEEVAAPPAANPKWATGPNGGPPALPPAATTPVGPGAAAGGGGADSRVTPARVVADPDAGPAIGALTPDLARAFIESYLRDGATNDIRAEMSYYADEVDYFNKGPAGREYIRRDVSNYYKRWPERSYEIVGPVTATPGTRPGETAVRFQVRFRCRGRGGASAAGRTDNVFTLQGHQPGEVRIVAMKEQRVR